MELVRCVNLRRQNVDSGKLALLTNKIDGASESDEASRQSDYLLMMVAFKKWEKILREGRLNEDVIDYDLLEDRVHFIDETHPEGAILTFLPMKVAGILTTYLLMMVAFKKWESILSEILEFGLGRLGADLAETPLNRRGDFGRVPFQGAVDWVQMPGMKGTAVYLIFVKFCQQYLNVCETSLSGSGAGPNAAAASQFVRGEMLPSGYLIWPCDGGVSIIHIVDHLNLEALCYIKQIAQETSGEVVNGLGRQPAVLRTSINVFNDDCWSIMSCDGAEDVIVSGILWAKASMLSSETIIMCLLLCPLFALVHAANVLPAVLVRFMRDHPFEWADFKPTRFTGSQIIMPLCHAIEHEERERKRCGTHGRSDGAWNWISDFRQTIFSGEYGKSNRLKANPFCQPTIFSTNRNGHGRKRCGTHGRSNGAWNWISDFRQTIFSGEYGKLNRLKANPFCQPTIFSTNRNGHGREKKRFLCDSTAMDRIVARDKAYTWMYVAKSLKCFFIFLSTKMSYVIDSLTMLDISLIAYFVVADETDSWKIDFNGFSGAWCSLTAIAVLFAAVIGVLEVYCFRSGWRL
ncbi:hypothetical protein RHSIM_Rhsim05G0125900 [Rhododendron simsii]|uniref:START domain-containing protein n=1 Tax=Rhododendron simsii TaxID=118357 RepID=A0A834H009_RHOSS|nr:hypothetical protein RHSIM_Rhsim05G0125900 [Rhododendron simsii]